MRKRAGSRGRRSHPALLLSALVSAGAGGPWSLSSAAVCSPTTTSFRVENLTSARVLNSAVNCSDGGQMEAVWAGAVVLDAPMAIGRGTFLSITGEDKQAEVEGGLSTRLFDVSAGGELYLTQLKLSRGAALYGGAIRALDARLALIGCVFDGNIASDGSGGAVWASGGDMNITGGEFQDNSATESGGAVFTINTEFTVQGGARFEQNIAGKGGALYSEGLSCSLSSATFISNDASLQVITGTSGDNIDFNSGGAAAFVSSDVTIKNSDFTANIAAQSGGAIFGGIDTLLTVDDTVFWNNTATKYGGAISASNATLRGGTELMYNFAGVNGGAVYGWDPSGTIELGDIFCSNNTATVYGGCLYTFGRGLVMSGTAMHGNVAYEGGCIYAPSECNITVEGGDFTCHATRNGGFLFASDGSLVSITGGLASNNLAGRKGGAVYCSGESSSLTVPKFGGAKVSIAGGFFEGNTALEVGGAIMIWGPPTVVTITGGTFKNNYATFFGGFIFVELEASLTCDGATIQENYAGGQGGGIYARGATWVNSSCDMMDNESPQGAAVYLTYVGSATFENLEIADNTDSGGSVLFVAESSMIARKVTLESEASAGEEAKNRAIQMEGLSTLVGVECVFKGWLGDTVIYNANAAKGSLVLDSCDFSGSSAATAVISPYSDAEIRNAVVGDQTLVNAVNLNPLELVDRALECADPNACDVNRECVNSALGVLCECLPQSDDCLDDGGTVSLTLISPPDSVTYSPSSVSFDLQVSATDDGTTYVIWDLAFAADELLLTAAPSSGILPPGGKVNVTVTGTPLLENAGGIMTSSFVLTPVGVGGSQSLGGNTSAALVELDVNSTFYRCPAFQYAVLTEDNDGDGGTECEQCTVIDGSEGVDCDLPGATLTSLPVREGYWRSSKESLVIHSCLNSEACTGATEVSSSDDYCAVGYEGPYCAVCADGHGQGMGRSCHSCETKTTKSRLLIAVGVISMTVFLLFVLFAVVFLIGGLDAVGSFRRSVGSLPPFPSGLTLQLSRFSWNNGGPPKDQPVLNGGSADLGKNGYERSTIQPADGVVSHIENSFRYSQDTDFDAEVMASDGRSSMTNVGAGGRLLGLSRVDSTTYEAEPSCSRAAGHSASIDSSASLVFDDDSNSKQSCCSIKGTKMKNWVSRLPFDKLKILIVVWQILTVFPSITGVNYPPSYSRFLSVIDVVNFDLGQFFSTSCLLPSVTFYERLLATTLAPIGLAGVLVLTYHYAKRTAGIGSRGIAARRAAWSRHMAAGLMLTFLVFTSASTVVFKTFACDKEAVEGKAYLREDYRISCTSNTYTYFMFYSGFMIIVYPIGIPLLYFFILWKNRHLLNPSASTQRVAVDHSASTCVETASRKPQTAVSPETTRELKERIEMRKLNPDLVPSMFLWKDFGPGLYYYEVIECGRRILLTGVLIFIAPHNPAQAAMACIFAFATLLGFELSRPYLDPADSWLYRLGCVVIFLSNFLALLIKVDATGEDNQNTLGGLLVTINVLLVLAVLTTSWFATQQQVDDSQEESIFVTMAKTVATSGLAPGETSARRNNNELKKRRGSDEGRLEPNGEIACRGEREDYI